MEQKRKAQGSAPGEGGSRAALAGAAPATTERDAEQYTPLAGTCQALAEALDLAQVAELMAQAAQAAGDRAGFLEWRRAMLAAQAQAWAAGHRPERGGGDHGDQA